jgi:hypothetical protein
MLDHDGLSPREAMKRFLNAVGDREVYTDEPDFDAHWLGMMEDAAGISVGERIIGVVKRLIRRSGHQGAAPSR